MVPPSEFLLLIGIIKSPTERESNVVRPAKVQGNKAIVLPFYELLLVVVVGSLQQLKMEKFLDISRNQRA